MFCEELIVGFPVILLNPLSSLRKFDEFALPMVARLLLCNQGINRVHLSLVYKLVNALACFLQHSRAVIILEYYKLALKLRLTSIIILRLFIFRFGITVFGRLKLW